MKRPLQGRLVLGHLTDLHLRRHLPGSCPNNLCRSRDVPRHLEDALDHLVKRGVDHLVITGDLLDVPGCVLHPSPVYREPVEAWSAAAERDYREVKGLLDRSGLSYTVLAGNHDHEPALWKVFPKEPEVQDLPQGFRLVRFHDREWTGHVPRRFDRERKRWERMLADEQSPPQIHLQHYVVTPVLNESYPHSYYEGEDLKERTGASGKVALSLSGHYHRGTELLRGGSTVFTTGPCFARVPHPFRIYTLTPGGVEMERVEQVRRETSPRPVVFLDRDGVLLTEAAWSTGPESVRVLPGAGEAVRRLREAGWVVVVISNQSCVGCGYMPTDVVETNNECMCAQLVEQAGSREAQPDAIYFSVGAGNRAVHPDLRDRSLTKPSPALLHQACRELRLDPASAWMVGDRASDLETARAFGARPVLVRSGHGVRTLDELEKSMLNEVEVVDDLASAARHILENPSP